jgi:hypothetical protein
MKPGMAQNTTVLNRYALLTNIIVTTPVKWTEGNDQLFHDANNPDRQERFASKFHKDNVFECMQVTGTHLEWKCGCHHDGNNSFHK